MMIDELDTNSVNINEATKFLFATGAYEDKDEAKNAVNSALEVIEELKWWRGQDLVRREDIPKYELWCYARRNEVEFNASIEQIPKAEYMLAKDL